MSYYTSFLNVLALQLIKGKEETFVYKVCNLYAHTES